ncbi:HXXEE domain-containing protein, partial [Francisella tularensis subsp. holarctica]|nr:HXXEE domain-containing protein [Francisella tularensis subsp. holarctica]
MMIDSLARNQNWAKVAQWAGIFFTVLLFANFSVYDPHFWVLINITLYLFHQTEE